jgi:hypothetical protein
MNVVVDAQIINWYLIELRGGDPPSTAPPSTLINQLGGEDVAWLDEGGMIEHEWRNGTDPDWFNQWYPDLLSRGGAFLIPVSAARQLLRTLHTSFGFPHTRDAWYVSTACAVRDATDDASVILSEDLDFYDPPRKATCTQGRRHAMLLGCEGRLARHLRRREGIEARSLAAHAP